MRLKGKVAIVTGAARGMGAAQARLLASEGSIVVAADVLDDKGRQVVSEIRAAGHKATYAHLNVTSEDNWKSLIAETAEEAGLHILVNNAGITGAGFADKTSTEGWDRLIAVNARGPFLGMKYAIPAMRESGGGSIVNISSIAAFVGMDVLHFGYNASKAALHMMTKAAAVQHGRDGIRVNSVHPGALPAMAGTMQGNIDPAVHEKIAALLPLGRIGRVEEVAQAVLFLASDDSSYITGTELIVDGGMLAKR